MNSSETPQTNRQVALFVTCLVNTMRPSVAFSAVRLIEHAGYEVIVPETQGCCGQPNYNGGDPQGAVAMAKQVVDIFDRFETVVVPSGSCGGMLKTHYPGLLAGYPDYADRANRLATRVSELSEFLVNQAHLEMTGLDSADALTFHDCCAGLRELEIKDQPRQLLAQAGYEITEMVDPEACCGFGGTFCIKYPDISNRLLERKLDDVATTNARLLVMGDTGCLLSLEGKALREESNLRFLHYAELLAERLQEDHRDKR